LEKKNFTVFQEINNALKTLKVESKNHIDLSAEKFHSIDKELVEVRDDTVKMIS